METWKIYKHTNKINGKCYIGQTCRKNPNERWNNGKGYNGTIFAKAIEKYGWDNFEHEIIEDDILSEDEANEREMYWIEYYNSYAGVSGGNGYNMTRGGDDRADKGRPVYQIDIETRKIIKEFPSALNAQRETEAKCVYACCSREKTYSQFIVTGNSYWCFVDEWSKDWEPKKGRINYVDKNGNKICDSGDKQVCQINKNGEVVNIYKTAVEAALKIGANGSSHIIACCRGVKNKTCGYYWCYKKDLSTFIIPKSKKLNKQIKCLENNTVYNSIAAASEAFGIDRKTMKRMLNGHKSYKYKYTFIYIN